ncbi:UBX domain-containing protein [Ophiocordyceps sinensis CO18]|uniref:UBX domain-containing protein n=1 Tax=Ophiocordyceps sinensis (strain Co18 / CGMCC 3.14243) TaxID=911162 RepID=T5AEV8_OPHSC|nr:UBX domain-containing protein [Ophiocordyceps sinensis CO18]
MADADVDVGQLSASQRDALEQYTQVTNQDLAAAVPLLQRSQWNVQIAIAKFFDGEGPDPVAEAMTAQEIPRTSARHESLQESLMAPSSGRPSRSSRRDRTDAAPRIVPQQPLYAFVECFDVAPEQEQEQKQAGQGRPDGYEHKYTFRIVSTLPRVVYEPSTTDTMGDKIGKSGNLIVEDMSLGSDETGEAGQEDE